MYRGHILAEWENLFDLADIDGNRSGGQDFFYPRSMKLLNNMQEQKKQTKKVLTRGDVGGNARSRLLRS
jgi:hypothetical protein